MDSLDRVSLLAFLPSPFSVDINEEKLIPHQTVRLPSEFVKEKEKEISVKSL
ncbi:MAG: hypothetical protein OEM01_05460 [Desulfobulbaceae bacterium]|nr:hypothetical protein [Desulfobulbaceae bacterium]